MEAIGYRHRKVWTMSDMDNLIIPDNLEDLDVPALTLDIHSRSNTQPVIITINNELLVKHEPLETSHVPEVVTTTDPLGGVTMSIDRKINRQRRRWKKIRGRKKVKRYICAVCNARFKKEDLFHAHVNELHIDEYPFPCPQCNKRFAEPVQLKTHQSTHDPNRFKGEPKHACEFCGKKYHLKISLATHRKLKHFGYKPPKKEKVNLEMMLPRNKGSIKPRRFIRSKYFTKIHQIGSFACAGCDIKFTRLDEFEDHISSTHSGDPVHPCDQCGKGFSSAEHLRLHEAIHHKLESALYSCQRCETTFKYRYQLQKHMICHRDKRFKCEICHQNFVHRTTLQRHLKSVHGETQIPYLQAISAAGQSVAKTQQFWKCDQCNRQFRYHSNYLDHIRVHTGDLPFSCSSCDLRFATSWNLASHERSHLTNLSHLKMYKCLVCGRDDFKRYFDYINHRKSAHFEVPIQNNEAEKAFGCGVCGKPYYLRESAVICAILRHDPTKLREKMFRYKCSECLPDCLGYRNLLVLRNHWAQCHDDKQIPAEYRNGMVNGFVRDELPTVVVDRVKAEEIREKGIPEGETYDFTLYVEFDLIASELSPSSPSSPEKAVAEKSTSNKYVASAKKSNAPVMHAEGQEFVAVGKVSRECALCNMKFSSAFNLRRHITSKLHLDNEEEEKLKNGNSEPEAFPVLRIVDREEMVEAKSKLEVVLESPAETIDYPAISIHQQEVMVEESGILFKMEAAEGGTNGEGDGINGNRNGDTVTVSISQFLDAFEDNLLGQGETAVKLETDVHAGNVISFKQEVMEEGGNGSGVTITEDDVGCSDPLTFHSVICKHEPVNRVGILVKQEPNEEMDNNSILCAEYDVADGYFAEGNVHVKIDRATESYENEDDVTGEEISGDVYAGDVFVNVTEDASSQFASWDIANNNLKDNERPTKRRPGRPPKSIVPKVQDESAKMGRCVKRRPGRPPRLKQSIKEGDSNLQNSNMIVKRGRGRPPKKPARHTGNINHEDGETLTPAVQVSSSNQKSSNNCYDKTEMGENDELVKPAKLTTVNLNDLSQVRRVLGSREMRLVLVRVDDDDFDFTELLPLENIC